MRIPEGQISISGRGLLLWWASAGALLGTARTAPDLASPSGKRESEGGRDR